MRVLEKFSGHPHIINLIEQGRASFLDSENNEWGQFYLLFEYPRAGHLIGMLMEMDPLGEDAGRFFINQLIKALETMHSCDIAHRDLKPENIMLDQMLNLKLIDFGLTNSADTQDDVKNLSTFAGTPPIPSPRDHLQKSLQRKADRHVLSGRDLIYDSVQVVSFSRGHQI